MCILSHFSLVGLFATLWTTACQAALPMEFSRREYWSGSSRFSPADFSNPGIEPASPASPALAGRFFTTRATWRPLVSRLLQFHRYSCYDVFLLWPFNFSSVIKCSCSRHYYPMCCSPERGKPHEAYTLRNEKDQFMCIICVLQVRAVCLDAQWRNRSLKRRGSRLASYGKQHNT